MRVRPPVFAGRFYPAESRSAQGPSLRFPGPVGPARGCRPKALIVPHAGYVFSGPVAASGYAWLTSHAASIDRVVLLGTCHTPGIHGLAATSVEAFLTPLGTVPVDRTAVEESLRLPPGPDRRRRPMTTITPSRFSFRFSRSCSRPSPSSPSSSAGPMPPAWPRCWKGPSGMPSEPCSSSAPT